MCREPEASREGDGIEVFTLRHRANLDPIGVGRAREGWRIIVLVCDLDIRVLSAEGELLRHLTLDPTRDYQPLGQKGPGG
jgi:hypothetical protein